MIPAVSQCGTYIAMVVDTELQIHTLLPGSLYRAFALRKCFLQHYDNCGYITPRDFPIITIHSVQWEIPTERSCGKVAVYASDGRLSLIFVFDFTEEWPAVIEVETAGISTFQWIPGASEEGSYSNCSQIAVFSNLATELRVYSLDCTRVEFIVPKPQFGSIITRPGKSRIWSVIASPYYDKNLPARSILADSAKEYPDILHFYNNGSTSTLFARLALTFMPSSESSFTWSPSGTWLLYFDDADAAYGYSLKIFNLLALHSKPVSSVQNHTAQATLEYVENAPRHLEWLSAWGTVGNIEYVATLSRKIGSIVHVKAYAISQAATTKMRTIDISKSTRWESQSDSSRTVTYQERAGSFTHEGTWKYFQCLGSKLVAASDRLVAVISVKEATPIHLEAQYTVSTSLEFVLAHLLSESELALVFSDHVAVLTLSGVSVLATSRYRFNSAHFRTDDDLTRITLVEETPSGPVWRQVLHNARNEQDYSNLDIMRRFDYEEENSKVVKLMRDVQHSEWGQKNRPFDVTDTFQVTSKRRRSLGSARRE